ncbi:MAG: potassium-transporting ATPase subunit KdpA, partial [Bacteroidota bacterium]|nr:potassium-transporting ATPase subunit KdpA [Bacteroidota bacterium]
MNFTDIFQFVIYFVLLILLIPVLGKFMTKVFKGDRHILSPALGWMERIIYRAGGIDPAKEDTWKRYALDLLIFNFIGFIVLFFLQLFQQYLPMNPGKLPGVRWHLAFNTAVSFITNTNWQSYSGETTLSYFVQMVGLTVQNFLSAATGIAVFLALVRGITRKSASSIGNFWVDMTRSTVYILLPLSVIMAVILVGQGVIQNFSSNIPVITLEGHSQIIPGGPVGSQVAIKQLGTNGGGFFGANSAHPFENPTPFSNFIEMLAILLIPAALTYVYGKMVGSEKEGWMIFTAMFLLLIAGLGIALYAEMSGVTMFHNHVLMEGKETRFGVPVSVLWSTVTTAASNGSVNSMMDSLSPVAGLVSMINIMLGEVVFGGVGSGMYGIIVFIILTVFIAGLMVGRTPEYQGKKIGAFEVQMSILAILAPSLVILLFSAVACVTEPGLAGLSSNGPHGLSQILYAFTSAAGNNGSAFAGLNANTVYYNLTLAAGMLIGRFGVIIPVLAIAGNMSGKKITPVSQGTFRTDNVLF